MVLKGRTDYTIDFSFFPKFVIGEDTELYYRIKESPNFNSTYVACNKTKTALHMISHLNTIIDNWKLPQIFEANDKLSIM